VQKLKEIGKFNVTLERYTLRSKQLFNIIAELPGTIKNEHYIIGAHLDSISQATGDERLSPGAEDDGSGSVGLLEMAKVFAAHPPKQTMHFIWFTGEEQGLVGSERSSAQVVARGDKGKVKLMVNMDMIGYSRGNPLKVLLETKQEYRSIVQQFQEAAKKYCDKLETAVSFNPFGSDHVPYLNRGMPALLTIDNDWSRYPHYHRTTDTHNQLVPKMAIEIIKMNVAATAQIIGYQ